MSESILFVDDEDIMLNFYRTYASSFNLHAYFESECKKAVTTLQENKIDVIVADHNMSDMTGTELLAYVKLSFPGIKRILATGFEGSPEVVEAVQNGTVEHLLPKPFNLRDLFNVLDQYK